MPRLRFAIGSIGWVVALVDGLLTNKTDKVGSELVG